MSDILLLEPIFKERIWGGNLLRTKYGYDIPSKQTGEAWVISGHHHGSTKILNGRFEGLTLDSVFVQNRHLFNDIQNDTFPLLTKILDANDDLSVQVHPDDLYAKKYANDLGKTECWYILDAKPDAFIVLGHHAKSKQEFIQMIEENRWDELLIKRYVKKGDFIYVPSGTLHTIGKGILILETQQSSDTTYRVYDYDRLDAQGNSRELHLKESIEVTMIPHQDLNLDIKEMKFGLNVITQYVSNQFFTLEKWDINQKYEIENNKFRLMSVISGKGIINGIHIEKGCNFIILSNVSHINLEGTLELIVSYL